MQLITKCIAIFAIIMFLVNRLVYTCRDDAKKGVLATLYIVDILSYILLIGSLFILS